MTIDIDRILRETFVARAEYHASIGSTNDQAAKCAARDGEMLPLLVLAQRQTAGRGRGGNRWWSGDGALMFSLLMQGDSGESSRRPRPWVERPFVGEDGTVPFSGSFPGLVSLATAVAVVDAVAPLVPEHRVGIHWPNDVFAAGRKLAGILIEVLPHGRQVVGIGLNTNNTLADAPAALRQTATTLRELRRTTCDQTETLVSLLNGLEHQYAQLACDPEGVAARADALCLQRGEMLKLQWATRTVVGRCQGIARDGALLLQTPVGSETFYSGIVSSLNITSSPESLQARMP